MDFPIHIDTISMGLPIVYFKGSQVKVSNYDVLLSLKVVLFNLSKQWRTRWKAAWCADPDEMQHYAAFHLGLHCLPKYPFKVFQQTKG